MTSTTVILIVMTAEILLIAIAAIISIRYFSRISVQRSEEIRKITYEFTHGLETTLHDIARDIRYSQLSTQASADQFYHLLPKLIESTAQEIPDLVAKGIEAGVTQSLSKYTPNIGTEMVKSSEPNLVRMSDQNTPLIRELSHALNT